MKKLIITLISFLTSSHIIGAEYNGKNIDGELFSSTVYSYKTGNYYNVDIEFSGSDVTIHFYNGGYINVAIDEDIDDPSSISAYNYDKNEYWDIDVDLD